MYEIKLPKVLFLALDIAHHYQKSFFNTSDLTKLANQYSSELVRTRVDKKDYKYEDDTKFGGLRGNFSTLLTWRGLVKKGNTVAGYYGIGKDDRILNAVHKGEIVLRRDTMSAHTNNKKLKELLETEAWLFKVKEAQAHIKVLTEKKPELELQRDHDNFAKESVVKNPTGQYFIRAIVSNFVDSKNNILEFNILNLWDGLKFKKKNIHSLIVIPTKDNPWAEIYALKNEDLYSKKPFTVRVDLDTKICTDKEGNTYKLYTLKEAAQTFSKGDENIQTRLDYSWTKLREERCNEETEQKEIKNAEFWIFIEKFLNWDKNFSINGKDVIEIKNSSSGGPDIRLIFSGGTVQNLELEHDWKNYLDHGHQNSNAWVGSWLFAEEAWSKDKILKLFSSVKKEHGARIPDVFLCIDNGVRKAYQASWSSGTFTEIPLSFPE